MEQIVPVILILVGLLFVIIGLVLTLRAKAASNWPSTSGIMLKSEITERTTKQRTKSHQIITYTSYEPMVEYQYTVEGKSLTGNRLSFGLTRLTLEKAQEVLKRFPVNAQVPVYYNPRRVKDSRLEVSAAAAAPQLIIGVIIGAIGVVWLIVTLL
jgi:hypothetical protein